MTPANFDALIREACAARGFAFWGTRPWDIFLFGIRSTVATADAFDDAIGCRYLDDAGAVHVDVWRATTDPGKPHLEQPMRPQGCAILPDGQYRRLWTLGKHKGQYPALVQKTPVAVWRDNDRDAVLDFDTSILAPPALIGLNCHKAGTNSERVGAWSAACQVHKAEATFREMMALVGKQSAAGLGVDTSYTLFDLRRDRVLQPVYEAAR